MQQTGNAPVLQLLEEIEAGTALLEVLRQEQENLIAANIEALGALTEEKTRLFSRMSELAMQRQRALASQGFEDSPAGFEAYLKTTPSLSEAWEELMTIAREGKELNRVNGMLIGQHMARNQTALNALKGGDQSAGALYGPNGQAATGTASRRFVVG